MSRKLGYAKENLACEWLETTGIKVIAKNYYSRFGEIDIIALENKRKYLFIEVKYTRTKLKDQVYWKITKKKKLNLIKTAMVYLSKHLKTMPECRFDLIIMTDNAIKLHKNIIQVT